MARIEKTVFISYRRKDISWALAVYQYLTSQKYDVFFDYTSIPSGDFEQIIVSNIRARAHFVLILTPTALDRADEPGDWLRREIETALSEKRNIIPLFLDRFTFGSPSVARKLTGRLADIKRYNGLDIPSGYFLEAMERLSERYLNVPLNAVIHPVSTEVRKMVKEEQVAADKALEQNKEVIEELVKPAEEEPVKPMQAYDKKAAVPPSPFRKEIEGEANLPDLRPYGIGAGILLIAVLGIFGINSLFQNAEGNGKLLSTQPITEAFDSMTSTTMPTLIVPTETSTSPPTETSAPPTPTSALGIGYTLTSPKDGMVIVYVPAGEFMMGSNAGDEDEEPVHTIALDSYWIDQTEVTNAMYSNCVEDGVCNMPAGTKYYLDSDYGGHPVVYVTWYDAANYCSWAGRRLPTEAEWEKAASWDELNQTKCIYPWGNNVDCTYANYDNFENYCVGGTTAVGSYPKGTSNFDVYDMAGNVWEWVNSLYQPYPYRATDGREDPNDPGNRVLRGGSWLHNPNFIRTTIRASIYPSYTNHYYGFRCAMDATE